MPRRARFHSLRPGQGRDVEAQFHTTGIQFVNLGEQVRTIRLFDFRAPLLDDLSSPLEVVDDFPPPLELVDDFPPTLELVDDIPPPLEFVESSTSTRESDSRNHSQSDSTTRSSRLEFVHPSGEEIWGEGLTQGGSQDARNRQAFDYIRLQATDAAQDDAGGAAQDRAQAAEAEIAVQATYRYSESRRQRGNLPHPDVLIASWEELPEGAYRVVSLSSSSSTLSGTGDSLTSRSSEGLSEAAIRALLVDAVGTIPSTGKPEQEDCPVCLEGLLQGQSVITLLCKHLYHTECLIPWLRNHGRCPTCRADIVEDPVHEQIREESPFEFYRREYGSMSRALQELWLGEDHT